MPGRTEETGDLWFTDHRYLIVDIADALQNAVQDPKFLCLEALIVNLPDTVAMGAGLSGNNLL